MEHIFGSRAPGKDSNSWINARNQNPRRACTKTRNRRVLPARIRKSHGTPSATGIPGPQNPDFEEGNSS